MAAKQYLSKSGHGTSWWVIAGLVALLAVDGLLVWFAFSATRATEGVDRVPTPPLTPSAAVTPTPTPEPTPDADLTVAPVSVLLTAFDASVAYRAVTGACPATPGIVEVTADGGATWSSASVPDASTPVAIAVSSRTEAVAVAASAEDCAAETYRTFGQGAEWAPADTTPAVWLLSGAGAVSPAGAASAPCAATPVQVSGANADAAAVLCDDAVVAVTTDGGATWSSSTPVPGAAAVAMAPDGTVLVLVAAQNDCAGVQVAALGADGAPAAPGECVPTDAADGASTIAVDTAGGLWLWSGAVVARSADGGVSW